jgi:hypothetical protein
VLILAGEHMIDAGVIAVFPRPDTSEPNLFNFPSMSLLAKLSVGLGLGSVMILLRCAADR